MTVLPLNSYRDRTSGVISATDDATGGTAVRAGAPPLRGGDAREAGRRLAADPLVTQPASDGNEAVVSGLYRCRAIVMRWELHVEIVRARRGCAVVRVTCGSEDGYLFVKSAFEAIPANLGFGNGVVVEAAHNKRDGDGRLYTLLWTSSELSRIPDAESALAEAISLPGDAGHRTQATGKTAPDAPAALRELADSGVVPVLAAPPFRETLAVSSEDLHFGDAPPDRPTASQTLSGTPLSPTVQAKSIAEQQAVPDSSPDDATSEAVASVPEPPNSWVSTMTHPSRHESGVENPRLPPSRTTSTLDLPVVERAHRAPWLWRRGWILAITILAGVFGAQAIALAHSATYTARAILVVQSGAGASGPGAANDAAALAITYAAFIPTDGATIKEAARILHIPESHLAANISMSVESGTSVLVLNYTASTAAEAVVAADTISQTISQSPPGSGIPSKSISVVRRPISAYPTSSLRRYALPIGGVLGLAIGLIFVLAIERSDPHLDDTRSVSEVFSCPSNATPGEVGLPELARAIALLVDGSKQLTVVPLAYSDRASAVNLATGLQQVWPPDRARPPMSVSSEFDSAAIGLSQGTGPTVIVLAAGASKQQASTVAERLHLIKRDPIWAVVTGRLRPSSNAC